MVPSKYRKICIFFLILSFYELSNVVCPPPPPKRQKTGGGVAVDNADADGNKVEEEESQKLYEFPYSKYLELVVQILESQPKFQERLKDMSEQDIKAGKIADHIDDLDDEVFTKLTKAKIEEIERLRATVEEQIKIDGDARNVKMPEHLDVNDWQKFTKEDLRKLIQKTVADMNTIDEERKQKFKQYEMEKKAEEDHKLAQMSPEERERERKAIEEAKKRHNQHEAINHPGGKEQLEEVWEERDHMDRASFDPKTFFALHDLNGDGHWNDEEIEALFQIELEKVYNETNPDDDPKERIEEMYRMREHVVKQMDKNGDRLISLEEFLSDTEAQASEGTKDEGWKDLGEQKIYTEEELAKFEREYAQQQGWGDHPYDPVPVQAAAQQFGQPPPPPQPVHNPVPAQQYGQPPPPQPMKTDQQQAPPVKIEKVDPVYGI